MKRIYFIKPVGKPGPIKIGCSNWPDHRLETIAHWSPIPLEIVARGDGDHTLEAFIMRRFKHCRLHKEWFRPDPDLIAAIWAVQSGKSVEEAFGAVLRRLRADRHVRGQRRYLTVAEVDA